LYENAETRFFKRVMETVCSFIPGTVCVSGSLFQPAFMFMAGTAMAFSLQRQQGAGCTLGANL
jgi:predicted acyltransferase